MEGCDTDVAINLLLLILAYVHLHRPFNHSNIHFSSSLPLAKETLSSIRPLVCLSESRELIIHVHRWPTACIHALVVVCYYAAKPNKLTPRAQRHAYQTYMSGMPDSTQAQTSSTVRVPKGTGIESYNQRPQEQYGQPHRIDPAAYAEHYNYDDDTLEAIEVVDFAEEDKKYI